MHLLSSLVLLSVSSMIPILFVGGEGGVLCCVYVGHRGIFVFVSVVSVFVALLISSSRILCGSLSPVRSNVCRASVSLCVRSVSSGIGV